MGGRGEGKGTQTEEQRGNTGCPEVPITHWHCLTVLTSQQLKSEEEAGDRVSSFPLADASASFSIILPISFQTASDLNKEEPKTSIVA